MQLKYLVQRLFDGAYLCDGYAYGEDGFTWQNDLSAVLRFDSKEEVFEAMENENYDFVLLEAYIKN